MLQARCRFGTRNVKEGLKGMDKLTKWTGDSGRPFSWTRYMWTLESDHASLLKADDRAVCLRVLLNR